MTARQEPLKDTRRRFVRNTPPQPKQRQGSSSALVWMTIVAAIYGLTAVQIHTSTTKLWLFSGASLAAFHDNNVQATTAATTVLSALELSWQQTAQNGDNNGNSTITKSDSSLLLYKDKIDGNNSNTHDENPRPPLPKFPSLRFDWGRLDLHSPLAQRMAAHQSNCSLPSTADFRFRNRFGLGSDLHVWSVALCNAMELQLRVVTAQENDHDDAWIYWDQHACRQAALANDSHHSSSTFNNKSVLSCYFPQAELQCPGDTKPAAAASANNNTTNRTTLYRGRGRISENCSSLTNEYSTGEIRAAAMEFLFARVSPVVVQEAHRQLYGIFGSAHRQQQQSQNKSSTTSTIHNSTHGTVLPNSKEAIVPPNLITVHIRWGDKADEMELVPIQEYINAVEQLVPSSSSQRDGKNAENKNQGDFNIFLATEDPQAVQAFGEAAPAHWKIYVDAYFHQFLPHRLSSYNGNPQMSRALQGSPGLVALASLLVAMESNNFVLTTASNWSRVLNELRLNVVEPRLIARTGKRTRMIDLRSGEW